VLFSSKKLVPYGRVPSQQLTCNWTERVRKLSCDAKRAPACCRQFQLSTSKVKVIYAHCHSASQNQTTNLDTLPTYNCTKIWPAVFKSWTVFLSKHTKTRRSRSCQMIPKSNNISGSPQHVLLPSYINLWSVVLVYARTDRQTDRQTNTHTHRGN